MNLSLLGGLEYPKPIATISPETLFTAIQTGEVKISRNRTICFADPSHSAFEFYRLEGKSSKYAICKKELPLFMPGTFNYRNAEGFRTHAGIIVNDFDDVVSDERLPLYTRLVYHHTTLAVYQTPSGMRSIHQIVPTPTRAYEHAYIYDKLIKTLIKDGVIVEGQADDASREVHRGYLLYHDPNMYRHDAGESDVKPLVWDPGELARREEELRQQAESDKREKAERVEAQKQAREKRRNEIKTLSAKAVAEGFDKKSLDDIENILSQPSPIECLQDIDAIGYLESEGIIAFTGIERGGRREFSRKGADTRSGTVSEDGNVITVFSSTMIAELPAGISSGNGNDGVNINAHRAAIWFALGKDIDGIGNKSNDERDAFARDIYKVFGVGCDPDLHAQAWQRKQEIEKQVNPPPYQPKCEMKRSHDDKGRLLKPTSEVVTADEIVGEEYPLPKFPRDIISEIPIFQDYIDAWDGASECPLEYHFASLKAYLCAMLGRVIYLNEAMPLYPNCFVVLMGPAGFSRKSTAMSALDYYVASNVDPNVHIEGSINSSEGLGNTFALPDGIKIGEGLPECYMPADDEDEDDSIGFAPKGETETEEFTPASDKKKLFSKGMARKVDVYRLNEMLENTHSDEGFRVLGLIDEMVAFLQKSKNTATANVLTGINTMYNMPRRIENNSVTNQMVADYPCLSLITGIPTVVFKRYVGTSEAGSGFASRFEYYVVEDTIHMPISHPPNSVKIERVVDFAKCLRPNFMYQTAFSFTADAISLLKEYYVTKKIDILNKDVNKVGTQARFDTQLKKNALLFAALRSVDVDTDRYKITKRDLEISIALTDYLIACNDHVFDGVSETRMEETETRIMHYINKRYHTAAALCSRTRKDSETVKRALDAMVAVGKLRTETTTRAVKYYINSDSDNEGGNTDV